jgi:hypothetical protein
VIRHARIPECPNFGSRGRPSPRKPDVRG